MSAPKPFVTEFKTRKGKHVNFGVEKTNLKINPEARMDVKVRALRSILPVMADVPLPTIIGDRVVPKFTETSFSLDVIPPPPPTLTLALPAEGGLPMLGNVEASAPKRRRITPIAVVPLEKEVVVEKQAPAPANDFKKLEQKAEERVANRKQNVENLFKSIESKHVLTPEKRRFISMQLSRYPTPEGKIDPRRVRLDMFDDNEYEPWVKKAVARKDQYGSVAAFRKLVVAHEKRREAKRS